MPYFVPSFGQSFYLPYSFNGFSLSLQPMTRMMATRQRPSESFEILPLSPLPEFNSHPMGVNSVRNTDSFDYLSVFSCVAPYHL
jgi:hypothetical protein